MKSVLAGLSLVFIFNSISNLHATDYKVHILKPGETLSELLHKENYSPLYGKGNWVEKVLEANHLSENSVKNIKKGLPIILPGKEKETLKDEVNVKRSSTIQTGILANKISKHQNYGLKVQYFQRDMSTKNGQIDSRENFSIAMTYNDKNNHKFNNLNFNPIAELGVQTHGSNYTDNNTLNFVPTFYLDSALMFKNSDYVKIGPKVKMESSSRADIANDEIAIRRDNTLWAGVNASAQYEVSGTLYNFNAEILSTLASSDNAEFNRIQAQRLKLDFDFNLLNNYFVGLFISEENYQNIGTDQISSLGLNLRYILE